MLGRTLWKFQKIARDYFMNSNRTKKERYMCPKCQSISVNGKPMIIHYGRTK